MKTIFIHHRSPHHAVNSGYSRLIDFYNQAEAITGKPSVPYKLAKTLSSFTSQHAGLYDSSSVFKELELLKTLKASQGISKVVHYLNAERDVRYVVKLSKWFHNTSFCASFHKPPQILETHFKDDRFIKQLDGAIAVGNNQVDYIQNRFKIKNVAFIPHGIDTDFFKPKTHINELPTLLFVGQHLRDFEVFNKVISVIADRISNLRVQVVMHKAFLKLVEPQPYIQLFSDLDDEALRLKYQEASLLFLPMLDGTACNSILEAMACGLPIITTDVGANKDYLYGSGAILAPVNDNAYLIEATIALMQNEDQLEEIAARTRSCALKYDWQIIGGLVAKFHKSLL